MDQGTRQIEPLSHPVGQLFCRGPQPAVKLEDIRDASASRPLLTTLIGGVLSGTGEAHRQSDVLAGGVVGEESTFPWHNTNRRCLRPFRRQRNTVHDDSPRVRTQDAGDAPEEKVCSLGSCPVDATHLAVGKNEIRHLQQWSLPSVEKNQVLDRYRGTLHHPRLYLSSETLPNGRETGRARSFRGHAHQSRSRRSS